MLLAVAGAEDILATEGMAARVALQQNPLAVMGLPAVAMVPGAVAVAVVPVAQAAVVQGY
jgi:hypothetical protein